MPGYNGLISLEKVVHPGLSQPDRIQPEVDFELALSSIGLVKNNFTAFINPIKPDFPESTKYTLYFLPKNNFFQIFNMIYATRAWLKSSNKEL
jgi:hypothetical protein